MDLSVNTARKVISANPSLGETGDVHLFLPKDVDPNARHPFVLGIHGGGWRQGDQTSYHFLPPKLLPLGIGVVLVSYRKAPEFPFPAAFHDLTHILKWLLQYGVDHQLDTSRCLLFGGSAGAHLSMLLAARVTGENLSSPTIRGAACYCGIMDLAAQFQWDQEVDSKMTFEFLQATPEENPDIYRQASPLAHLHTNLPPLWIVHGDADRVVSINQSRCLEARLRELGATSFYREVPGLPHSMVEPDQRDPETPTLLLESDLLHFIQKNLSHSS